MAIRVHGKIPRTKRTRTRLLGAVQMAIGLRALATFQRTVVQFPALHSRSWASITPVSGDLTFIFGLHVHCTHTVYIYTHAGKYS